MAIFDQHSYCARCREKNKGKDPCVESKDTTFCKFCSAFTPEQLAQISTPSYKIKKEKREARKSVTATPTKDSTELVDPASVSVIGVVGQEDKESRTPPASRRISQESLRRWEKSAREASVICNQAASFNRCLFRVQKDMQSQLRSLRTDCKGKGAAKSANTLDELKYLMDFNSSITQAAAKTMEHLSEFVFISMGNLTLARHDAYLTHVKSGIKPDTVAALRTAPLIISTLFPDSVIKRAEEEISHYESRGQASGSRAKARFYPYERPDKKSDRRQDKKGDKPAWKNIGKGRYRKPRRKASNYTSRPAKGQQPYK